MTQDRALDGGMPKWWQYKPPSNLPLSDSANNEYHSGDPSPIGYCEECLTKIWDEDVYSEGTDGELYCKVCTDNELEPYGLF